MKSEKCFVVTGTLVNQQTRNEDVLLEMNGQVNVDCREGIIYMNPGKGITIRSGAIGADGFLAPHKINGTSYVRIVCGSGTIGITDETGRSLCEMSVCEGDEVIFEDPAEQHYYIAGKDGMKYRAVNFES